MVKKTLVVIRDNVCIYFSLPLLLIKDTACNNQIFRHELDLDI